MWNLKNARKSVCLQLDGKLLQALIHTSRSQGELRVWLTCGKSPWIFKKSPQLLFPPHLSPNCDMFFLPVLTSLQYFRLLMRALLVAVWLPSFLFFVGKSSLGRGSVHADSDVALSTSFVTSGMRGHFERETQGVAQGAAGLTHSTEHVANPSFPPLGYRHYCAHLSNQAAAFYFHMKFFCCWKNDNENHPTMLRLLTLTLCFLCQSCYIYPDNKRALGNKLLFFFLKEDSSWMQVLR